MEGDLELERPIVTVGDVPNRAALERAADKMGAVGDITTENVGMLNGKPVIFDPEAAYNEDIIKVSNAKFKNK